MHQANVLAYAGDLWRRTVDQLAKEFLDVATDYTHMDTASLYLVTSRNGSTCSSPTTCSATSRG